MAIKNLYRRLCKKMKSILLFKFKKIGDNYHYIFWRVYEKVFTFSFSNFCFFGLFPQ